MVIDMAIYLLQQKDGVQYDLRSRGYRTVNYNGNPTFKTAIPHWLVVLKVFDILIKS